MTCLVDRLVAEAILKQNCSESVGVLQLADSAFPIRGFAHSNGLEPPVKQGQIGSKYDLQRFLDYLLQVRQGSLPAIQAAYQGVIPFPNADLDRRRLLIPG